MTTGRWTRHGAGLAAAAALMITAVAAPAGATQGGVTVKQDVTYRAVDGEQLGLDVYQPAKKGKNRPAVVVVHGGGWTQGDKSLFAQQANQLAERGFVAFSVNYRLAPAHPYPAAVDDVEASVQWVRTHAKEYGVDRKRIGALGGSAGGHLVGMLGTEGEGSLKTGHRVSAVVSRSGPVDFVSLAPAAATNAGRSLSSFVARRARLLPARREGRAPQPRAGGARRGAVPQPSHDGARRAAQGARRRARRRRRSSGEGPHRRVPADRPAAADHDRHRPRVHRRRAGRPP